MPPGNHCDPYSECGGYRRGYAPKLPQSLVTDGCVYIAAEIKAPGVVHMSGDIFRVVFGPRTPEEYRPELKQVAQDLNDCGVEAILSDNIQRDAWMKFSVVSSMAACGIFHDVKVGAMQHPGVVRDDFAAFVGRLALWLRHGLPPGG